MKLRVSIIIIVLLLSMSGADAGCGGNSTPTTTSTTTFTTTHPSALNTSSSQSANGLSLSLSLDSTTYQSGQEITMFVDEQNSLSKVNHVLSSSKWPLNGLELGPSYPCGILSSYYPFGVAVFQGYYTSSNLQSGAT